MNSELLRRLVATPGISGREERIRDVVRGELAPLVDEVRTDALGNLVGVRRGTGPRVMLDAHMDTIGFLVSHVDEKGFLRLSPVGGVRPQSLLSQRVLVQGRKEYVGLVTSTMKPPGNEEPPKIEDLFVDPLAPADDVKANVSVGDPVSFHREPEVTDTRFASPYLDDRLGVYVLLEALREARQVQAEVYAVVAVQEEVGVRGARTSAFGAEPEIGIALDVTAAQDVPGSDDARKVTSLGEGTAIKLMDRGSISDPRLVRAFAEVARGHGIRHQMEILPFGGTDASGIQQSRAGVPVITISIPTRYVHTMNETADIGDIDASVALVSRFLESVHEVDLTW